MKIKFSELAGEKWAEVFSYCSIHHEPNVECAACLEYLSRKRVIDACDLTLEVDEEAMLYAVQGVDFICEDCGGCGYIGYANYGKKISCGLCGGDEDDLGAGIRIDILAQAIAANPSAWLKVKESE